MNEFEIDGIRFDAADCIEFDFSRESVHTVKEKSGILAYG